MNLAAASLITLLSASPPGWYLEQPLSQLGGDVDAMYTDPGGGIWAAVTGETTAEGRARVYYRAPDADGWREVYAGPTATDLSLRSVRPGELYLGFNQPIRAFQPTLLRLGGDEVVRLPAPAERLDEFEYLQVGDYDLHADDDGWACGQHGAIWRLEGDAWTRVPSPLPWREGDPHARSYCAAIEVSAPDDGLLVTVEGRGARWDGRAWRLIEGPNGQVAKLLPRGDGLAVVDGAFYRHLAGGWIELSTSCDPPSATELLRRGLMLDRSGALGLTPERVIEFGPASWSCRPIELDFGMRAFAAHDGVIWVLSDDGIHRQESRRIVTFEDAPGESLPRGLQYPLPVDLDLDGDLDVIAAASSADVLPSTVAAPGVPVLWRNLGGGAFQRSAELPPVELRIMPNQIAVGDLDGDADLDLVTSDIRGVITLWRREDDRYRPLETWTREQIDPAGGNGLVVPIYLADFEGDGDLDVIALAACLRNNGVGHLSLLPLPSLAGIQTSAWFDADGDGDADAVSLRWRDRSAFLRNDGDGAFTITQLPVTAEATVWADLDVDGTPELLAQRLHLYHLALPFRRCVFTPAPRCDLEDAMTTPAGVVADLDVDGRPDIIVGSLRVDEQPARSGEVHLGRADGFDEVTFASGRLLRPTPFDADGDGDLDVYTVDGGLKLHRGARDTWLRVHPRAAASDRLASGSWVTVRDAAGVVVASGLANAGVVSLGLPNADAAYAVTVRFPGGMTRAVAGVRAQTELVVHDVDGPARALALTRLWCVGAWRLLDPLRDLLLPLGLLALAIAAGRRSGALRPWTPWFAGFALAGLPLWLGVTVRAAALTTWLLGPINLASAAALTCALALAITAHRRVHAGPFRLRERIGAGAAATVWRAERGGEDLALKLYDAAVMESADSRERFFREARVGAEIQHPNLVQIVDAGRLDDGRCFLAMKRIDGSSLRTRLGLRPRLSIREAASITRDVAAALAALHRAGVIHRDVKPENIVLRGDGRAVLTDLGLARGQLFRTVTRLDATVGTLAYMSPEQAIGRPLDGRADLWSLGVVLYELLSGQRPFVGQHEMELLYLLCNVDPPPLRELDASIPEPLAEVVHRCLARAPEARYADADALRVALRPFVDADDA